MIDYSSIQEDEVNEENEKECLFDLLFLSPTSKSIIDHLRYNIDNPETQIDNLPSLKTSCLFT